MPNATCALTGSLSGPGLGAQTRTKVGFTLHKPSEENERSEIALDFHLILGFARHERTLCMIFRFGQWFFLFLAPEFLFQRSPDTTRSECTQLE